MRKFRILIALLLCLSVILGIYFSFLPLLRQSAEIEANRLAQKIYTQAVNNATEKSSVDFSKLLYKEEGKETVTLLADMSSVNLWKEYFINEIENEIKNKTYTVKIPAGTLLGNAFTYGKGPSVKITIVLGGYINADIDTKIESAGINQTKYSVYTKISSKMYTYLPFSNFTVENKTDVYLAECVTVGEVPSIYKY